MQGSATIDTSALDAKLHRLADKGRLDKIIYNALKAGGEIERAALSAAAPVEEIPPSPNSTALPVGAVKSDFKIEQRRDDKGQPIVIVGPGYATRHVVRWLEYGHKIVQGGYSRVVKDKNKNHTSLRRGPGKVTGEVDPHPFVRRTWDEVQPKVRSTIQRIISTKIVRSRA